MRFLKCIAIGGESIYSDEVFPVETHPRLQYRYRGLVGLATLNPDGLDPRDPEAATSRRHGSQFFITLSGASALNRNNTLFGKVQVFVFASKINRVMRCLCVFS